MACCSFAHNEKLVKCERHKRLVVGLSLNAKKDNDRSHCLCGSPSWTRKECNDGIASTVQIEVEGQEDASVTNDSSLV